MQYCCNCKCHIFNRCFICQHCSNLQAGLKTCVCIDCVAEGAGCGNTAHFRDLVAAIYLPDVVCAKSFEDSIVLTKQVLYFLFFVYNQHKVLLKLNVSSEAQRKIMTSTLVDSAGRKSTMTVATLRVRSEYEVKAVPLLL